MAAEVRAGFRHLMVDEAQDINPAQAELVALIAGDFGRKVVHRTTQYLNNYTEQSHRAVKQRYYPMLGFGSFESAARFCAAFDELRHYFRVRRRGEVLSDLGARRPRLASSTER